ncbi:hypothetical protein G9A89_020292 [Geosiphon pyriformis]|nr:hypothetical protein G9A89_020292 [Geosiphon pyriformis]
MADEATKTPIGKIDNFFFELSQNSRYTQVPAMYEHFKSSTMPSVPLIKFEKGKEKPTWEAYQVSWADSDHNELPPILF